jgi:hypothetical protein
MDLGYCPGRMPYCPVCRDEFRPGVSVCPEHGVTLVEALPSEAVRPDSGPIVGAELGVFHRMVAPVLVELLTEHSIEAQTADAFSGIRRMSHPEQAMVIVEGGKIGEARRIAAEELPQRLRELEEATANDPAFSDETATVDEEVTSGWGSTSDDETDDEVEEYEAEPIGYMEPAVARVFLEMCAEIDIGADTEYPLDEPPPPYARADGRVRVHVETVLVDHALRLMNEELADELSRRAIAYREPILEDPEQ